MPIDVLNNEVNRTVVTASARIDLIGTPAIRTLCLLTRNELHNYLLLASFIDSNMHGTTAHNPLTIC